MQTCDPTRGGWYCCNLSVGVALNKKCAIHHEWDVHEE